MKTEETNWPGIRAMEADTAAQDPSHLIAYILALADKNLLNGSMLTALANTTVKIEQKRDMYVVLHWLAPAADKLPPAESPTE